MEGLKICRITQLPIKVICISGTSRERGLQYGRQAKNMIRDNLKDTREILGGKAAPDRCLDHFNRRVCIFLQLLKYYEQEAYNEIAGIAEGAELETGDILFLNLASQMKNRLLENMMFACTMAAIETEGGRIGQTYNFSGENQRQLIGVLEKQEDGTQHFMLTEAGNITGISVNNHGIILLLNDLEIFYKKGVKMGNAVLLKQAMQAHDIQDAKQKIMKMQVDYSLHILLADLHRNYFEYSQSLYGTRFREVKKDFFNQADAGRGEKQASGGKKRKQDCGRLERMVFHLLFDMNSMQMHFQYGSPLKNGCYKIDISDIFK